ncbi:MAG: hypothetical protein NVS4B3_06900 [Gemmatimonadaceae bacterium]
MTSVSQEARRATPGREQEDQRGRVTLCGVTARTRQYKVITPVEGRLTTTWRDVIECHHPSRETAATISADGTVLLQKPDPRRDIRVAAGRVRGELTGAG